jgi:hypothetical protein
MYRSVSAIPSFSKPSPSARTFANVSIATRTVMASVSESLVPLIVIAASSCMDASMKA